MRIGNLVFPSLASAKGAELSKLKVGFAWKEVAIVDRGQRTPIVMTVVGPRGEVGLVYGQDAISSLSAGTYRLTEAPRTVSFAPCRGHPAGYPGGFIVQHPRCLRIRVDGALPKPKDLVVALGVTGCD